MKKISLKTFTKENKLNLLVMKTSDKKSFTKLNGKDHKYLLEAFWTMKKATIEKADYIVGVIDGKIYGIYKYVPGTYKILNWTEEGIEEFTQLREKFESKGLTRPVAEFNLDRYRGNAYIKTKNIVPAIGDVTTDKIKDSKQALLETLQGKEIDPDELKGAKNISFYN